MTRGSIQFKFPDKFPLCGNHTLKSVKRFKGTMVGLPVRYSPRWVAIRTPRLCASVSFQLHILFWMFNWLIPSRLILQELSYAMTYQGKAFWSATPYYLVSLIFFRNWSAILISIHCICKFKFVAYTIWKYC